MELFDRLTTVPVRLRKALQAKQQLVLATDEMTMRCASPMADAYKHELRIESSFWVDHSLPANTIARQLEISKSMIIRHLYGDVLDQLLPIKRAIANCDMEEALRLVDELHKSIQDA